MKNCYDLWKNLFWLSHYYYCWFQIIFIIHLSFWSLVCVRRTQMIFLKMSHTDINIHTNIKPNMEYLYCPFMDIIHYIISSEFWVIRKMLTFLSFIKENGNMNANLFWCQIIFKSIQISAFIFILNYFKIIFS